MISLQTSTVQMKMSGFLLHIYIIRSADEAICLQMLAMVPGPVKAVVLLYPIEESGDAKSKEEDERLQLEGQPKIDDTIFWVKQKVGLPSYSD